MKNIEFVGGIRGLGELEKRCHEDMVVAFSMYPTSIRELLKPWLTQEGSCRQNPHGSNQNSVWPVHSSNRKIAESALQIFRKGSL